MRKRFVEENGESFNVIAYFRLQCLRTSLKWKAVMALVGISLTKNQRWNEGTKKRKVQTASGTRCCCSKRHSNLMGKPGMTSKVAVRLWHHLVKAIRQQRGYTTLLRSENEETYNKMSNTTARIQSYDVVARVRSHCKITQEWREPSHDDLHGRESARGHTKGG